MFRRPSDNDVLRLKELQNASGIFTGETFVPPTRKQGSLADKVLYTLVWCGFDEPESGDSMNLAWPISPARPLLPKASSPPAMHAPPTPASNWDCSEANGCAAEFVKTASLPRLEHRNVAHYCSQGTDWIRTSVSNVAS